MEIYERPLISPQIEKITYNEDKLNVSIKLFSMYNIYCNKNVLTNLIIEDRISNKRYKYVGEVKKDVLDVNISKNDLREIKENLVESQIKVEVLNTDGNIIAMEIIKGKLWAEDEFLAELSYNDDNFKLFIINKIDSIHFFIIKEICINEINEIQKYFSNLKILFKSDKNMSNIMDENLKFNLTIDKKDYNSDRVEIVNENSFYAYYNVVNQNDIVEKLLMNDVFLTAIIQGKKYKNKIDRINKSKIYKSTYEVFKLKVKKLF